MAIKIHHGPNGSYKTSGAVWDDAVPAAKAGRLIITNIRGMSVERFQHLFSDLPDSFDLLYINHETQDGMERIRTWFQWAPRNAFLIFDEAQTLFPKKWTDKFLERFDYPGGMDKAHSDDRPMNFLDAWTRHRHWNWDVILTTPNIKYVHDDIRQTSEAAYQHSNLMLLGKFMKKLVGKDYKEAMHSAQENRAPTDGSNIVVLRKIDKRVFKLYDSTATGQHRDTMAGKNALASPRILVIVGIVACVASFVYYRNGTSSSAPKVVPPAVVPANQVHTPANPVKDSSSSAVRLPVQQVTAPPADVVRTDPYGQHDIVIKGSLTSASQGTLYIFQMTKGDLAFSQTSNDIGRAGYFVVPRGTCAADLVYKNETRTVVCAGTSSQGSGRTGEARLGAEQRAGTAAADSSKPKLIPVTVVADSSRGGKNVLQ